MRKSRIALTLAAVAAALVTATPQAAVAAPDPLPTAIVATFDVVGETFRVEFDDPNEIEKVYAAAAAKDGEQYPFPIGTIDWSGPGVNTGYPWHLKDATMVDWAIEWCDGRPSMVVAGVWGPPTYCPWGAKVVQIEAVNPRIAAVDPVVATFDVRGQALRVQFTDPNAIADLYDVEAGRASMFPMGRIVWGETQVNLGYAWHLADAVMVEAAAEVCDGRPSDIVEGKWKPANFCPWSAKLTHITKG
ncbi:hypothetical protein Val02_67680 [Virgisporangium aliadipatigenens]|uniref:BP74 N-terminal domain-containing protein n=1 Tax=Virgisporangium aliadipatigenens TaxID=741659 RepID=A0A8J3YSX5_9ACTN|nr:hypothetical protein [Virgisporangium aliadipatigenens]GIJ49882.1 hypothetical protein Val02_67680 [Virgisporangium aliadipatigenens]